MFTYLLGSKTPSYLLTAHSNLGNHPPCLLLVCSFPLLLPPWSFQRLCIYNLWSFSVIGGSCHEYHFCRDKNMLVVAKISSRKYTNICRDKHVTDEHTFVATKDVFCRDKKWYLWQLPSMIIISPPQPRPPRCIILHVYCLYQRFPLRGDKNSLLYAVLLWVVISWNVHRFFMLYFLPEVRLFKVYHHARSQRQEQSLWIRVTSQ